MGPGCHLYRRLAENINIFQFIYTIHAYDALITEYRVFRVVKYILPVEQV